MKQEEKWSNALYHVSAFIQMCARVCVCAYMCAFFFSKPHSAIAAQPVSENCQSKPNTHTHTHLYTSLLPHTTLLLWSPLTEHLWGCIWHHPGCFSLWPFRNSSTSNVKRKRISLWLKRQDSALLLAQEAKKSVWRNIVLHTAYWHTFHIRTPAFNYCSVSEL